MHTLPIARILIGKKTFQAQAILDVPSRLCFNIRVGQTFTNRNCHPKPIEGNLITILSNEPALELCEIKIYGTGSKNLVFKTRTWQSSVEAEWTSEKAIDGSRSTCSVTSFKLGLMDYEVWWASDLRSNRSIRSILIYQGENGQSYYRVGLIDKPPYLEADPGSMVAQSLRIFNAKLFFLNQ